MRELIGCVFAGLLFFAAGASAGAADAEVSEVRISKGYGILYLPLIVMEDRKLLEKKAAEAGLGDIKITWYLFDGGNIINDAMLAALTPITSVRGLPLPFDHNVKKPGAPVPAISRVP
jgi:NitT/TauT family transport system substrate-binding protein